SFSGVSCPSTTLCTAVGGYTKSSNVNLPLAERWNGSTWTMQSVPAPSGAKSSWLSDIACIPSTNVCEAVGGYVNTSGATVQLVEKWTGTKWVMQTGATLTGAQSSALTGVACSSTTQCTA